MTTQNAAKTQSLAQESEYKGRPVLVLKRDAKDPYPLKFGLGKASLIVEQLEAVKAFQAKHGNNKQKEASVAA